MENQGEQTIGFGGGCHWCTEAVFLSLLGVTSVNQGYIRALPPHDSWSEAVVVHFNNDLVDLDLLIDAHIQTHAAFSNHSLREKYRSAVYVTDDVQAHKVESVLNRIQAHHKDRLVTRLLKLKDFKPSAAQFRNYFETDRDRPFCKTYIRPKLDHLRSAFPHRVRE